MADEKMTIDEVKAIVKKGLDVTRYNLLENFPFIGEMALRFNIIPTYDASIDTACTDGKSIYFDCEFYSKLTEGQREFILAHELWHNLHLHFKRKGSRTNHQVWNEATDCEINHQLQNEGLEIFPDGCFPPPEMAGECAEVIYDYLLKKQQKQQKNQQNQNNQGGSNSQGGQGGGSSNGGDNQSQEDKQNQQGQGNGSGKAGKNKSSYDGGAGLTGKNFDKHLADGEKLGESQPKQGKWGEKGYDPDAHPAETPNARDLEQSIKEIVTNAVQATERRQGHVPGNVKKLIEKMLKPEINWKEALSQFVTKVIGGEASWKRISRHGLARGIYLPGRIEEKIKCVVAIDTSGSCISDIPKFLSELDSLLKSFGKYEVTVIQCDAEIQKVDVVDDSNPINMIEFETAGYGGTSFKEPFKWAREHGDDYNCFIYLTDGYGNAPKYPPPYPVLWVLTSDGCENFCDWGEKMKFKPGKYEER